MVNSGALCIYICVCVFCRIDVAVYDVEIVLCDAVFLYESYLRNVEEAVFSLFQPKFNSSI